MPDTPDTPPSQGQSPAQTRGYSFRDFQRLIRDRYHATDSARGTAGTFLYLAEEFGELATALAANNRAKTPPTEAERENLVEEFADVLAWLATLANINGVDFEDALRKYTDGGVEGVKE